MILKKQDWGYLLLAFTGIAAIIAFFLSPPIPQQESYHLFSDDYSIFGIPNFWNVISNFPFLVVGIHGLLTLKKSEVLFVQKIVFYGGVGLVALGSGYYHFEPNSSTLVWDRLPMTIAFTALFSIVISSFINEKLGKTILLPLLMLGLGSIVIWIQLDDLRAYALVQFLPMLAIPIILLFINAKGVSTKRYWVLLATYLLAKLTESLDYQIHHWIRIFSGHSVKHVLAASGIYYWSRNHPKIARLKA